MNGSISALLCEIATSLIAAMGSRRQLLAMTHLGVIVVGRDADKRSERLDYDW